MCLSRRADSGRPVKHTARLSGSKGAYKMNITIDTSAAQKSTVLSSAKMTGVSKTSEKSEAKTAQTTAKKYDTLDLSENAVQYLAKTENENTSTESGTEEQTDNAVTEAATQLVSESTDSNTSETIDSTELYSYTDDQLSELLAKGEITQLEYNNEMAKRTTAETE